jgi:cytochrome c553
MRRGFRIALGLACAASMARAEPEAVPLHPVEIRNPPSLGTIDTGLRDAAGSSVGISCVTCHDLNDDGALARKNEVPKDFHSGIEITHGGLRCESCHDTTNRTRLRLANGDSLAMREVIALCGQCHGPKLRDFSKGTHGGGRGYWDRTKGPWIRNSCVACHRAHAPAYPTVMPAPPPNDRFLPLPSTATTEESHPHE